MDFSNKIKEIREKNNLTQEEMAEKLHVSRQAVSNWENNKNYPDIGIIMDISKTFSISLDELIMNNVSKKLIKDGSETRKAKMNMISIIIGSILILIGVICIVIKGLSVEYVDSEGFLHENFFLLPIGFLFLFSGFVTFFTIGLKEIIKRFKGDKNE